MFPLSIKVHRCNYLFIRGFPQRLSRPPHLKALCLREEGRLALQHFPMMNSAISNESHQYWSHRSKSSEPWHCGRLWEDLCREREIQGCECDGDDLVQSGSFSNQSFLIRRTCVVSKVDGVESITQACLMSNRVYSTLFKSLSKVLI